MPNVKNNTPNYQDYSDKLEQILTELQSGDATVDTALRLYERGLELCKDMEQYLKTTKNKIVELRATFDTE